MAKKSNPSNDFWFVWRAPIILAILTVFGLLVALLKTDVWHWAAWLALAAPIVAGLWFSFKRSTQHH